MNWLRGTGLFPGAHRTRTPGELADRGDIGGCGSWVVECKNQAKISLRAWWEQVEQAAERAEGVPVMLVKRAGFAHPAMCWVVLQGSDWAATLLELDARRVECEVLTRRLDQAITDLHILEAKL